MNSANKSPDQTGYLILHETGGIISSGGDLENNEKTAEIIYNTLLLTDNLDPMAFSSSGFKKVSICFKTFCYVICMSNKKIHVVKRTLSVPIKPSNVSAEANLIDLKPAINNSIIE